MFHYLFTNDLRISKLDSSLQEAGLCFANDCVPSAAEDKNKNNNMNTLGFYFNLTKDSNCSKECENGNVRKVVLNFIKKFQFPNPRTGESLNQAIEDGITIAPMRVILQTLYLLNIVNPENAYLSKEEIAKYIFFDEAVAKKIKPDMVGLVNKIMANRLSGKKLEFPSDAELERKGCYWKQCKRQVREMVMVLSWSGCVAENADGSIAIYHEKLTRDNKADLFEILTYKERWIPDSSKSVRQNKESYQEYMDVELEYSDEIESAADEYKRAAKILKDYILEAGFVFEESVKEIKQFHEEFSKRFSAENLQSIPEDKLLASMFCSAEDTNESLCYWLDFYQQSRRFYEDSWQGPSCKFGLLQRKTDGVWVGGSPGKPEELSDEEALNEAKEIREALVGGYAILENASLDTLDDYERLDEELKKEMGKYAAIEWVHKYFYLLFPDKLAPCHSTDMQKHILYALRIKPSERYYGRSGQISMIKKYAGLEYLQILEVSHSKFGGMKRFCRLGTSDREINYAQDWKRHSIVAMGWEKLGNLEAFVIGNEVNKRPLTERLQKIYYPDKAWLASRKAGELSLFYKSNKDTIFVAMDGDTPLGLVDSIGEYYFEGGRPMPHRKTGTWHCCFRAGEKLPKRSAGHMTSCYELNDDDNLLYLYEKYFYGLNMEEEEEGVKEMDQFIPLIYNTSLETEFERNRIVFGAPGTGKSFRIKEDSEKILEDTQGSLERVTFHPDYTYSQFVGTYKPVSDANGDIRYEFVPGPFMRVYVNALKSGRTENPQPYLLLVEEINRARVAAVFGDIFQLLDRDDNGVSEYEIQAGEDMRRYLAERLGGIPDDYQKIKIPNNMFIWATMNSADQGVYPMDTAFKRRWNFEYIGIDESEDKVEDYVIPVGMGTARTYVKWNDLRKGINNILTEECKVNEDKLLGPFFLSKDLLANAGKDEKKENSFVKAFESKVIMYLFEDVMKMKPQMIFKGHASHNGKMIYSEICNAFETEGADIFDLELDVIDRDMVD